MLQRHCMLSILLPLLAVTTPTLSEKRADSTLRLVTALWRHGDRAPADPTFPTDTGNGEDTWPQGFEELSEEGMKQHQYLGRYLRKRYVFDYGFLSPNYSKKEVHVRSSDYNRTIMSALSNLAGMYPTPSGVDYLDGIPIWQPIPIHTQPREKDPMLWMGCPCPKAESIYNDIIMKSDQVQQIESDNQDFLKFLLDKTGKRSMTLDDVWSVWDPLNCERIHNDTHKWPDWVTPEIFKRIDYLSELSTTFYYHDLRLQRFRGSLLIQDIATRFDQKANRPQEFQPAQLKYFVYSAHDTTIQAVLEHFGAYDGHTPEYASALLFELHEKLPNVFTVETWYVNETLPKNPPVRVTVKGCDDQASGECTLENFVKLANTNVPNDWFTECQEDMINQNIRDPDVRPSCDYMPAAVAAIVLGVTTAIFFVAFVFISILHCRLLTRMKIAQREY